MTDLERFDEYQGEEGSGRIGVALTFLLVGLGVGAITALLLAPKSGRQMRKLIRRKYEDAREQLDDLQGQAGDWVERGSKWAKQAGARVTPLAKKFAE